MISNTMCNIEQENHQSYTKFMNAKSRKLSNADEIEYFSNTKEDLKVQLSESPEIK
jgi:hypothetical protein